MNALKKSLLYLFTKKCTKYQNFYDLEKSTNIAFSVSYVCVHMDLNEL